MSAEDFLDDLLDAFPDLPGVSPASYQPAAGGAPVATHVMIETSTVETDSRAHGEYADIRVPMRDVPEPTVDDTLVVDGVAWEFRVNQDRKLQRTRKWPFWLLQCRRKGAVALTGGRA
jgi:hypothetical protein